MVLRIAGAQVMNNGQQHYSRGNEGAHMLEETLNKIQERAKYYNEINEFRALLLHHAISDEIEELFNELDTCLKIFSYATDVAQAQWVAEFRLVQQQEARDIQQIMGELAKCNNTIDEMKQTTDLISNALQQLLHDKSSVLQEQSKRTFDEYEDAQQIVRTILSITNLQLPPKLLLGRQCHLESKVPVKTGITCDIYLAYFLAGERVAKKVFRLGISDKEFVEKYAKRFLRIANLWSDMRSDYTLPFYGVGMESLERSDHFQLYMVSPLMKNYDAITYLKQYRKNAGMKKNILQIITDAALGLQYLHNRHPPVVHSGMRGDNILIKDSGGAILGGFGLTKALESFENSGLPPAVMTGKTESQRWLAPEMFDDEPVLKPPCDVWGWAMAALEIVSGSIPYHKHKQAMTVMLKISKGPPKREDHPEFDIYAHRPDEMWELLVDCWKADPEERPTMDDVVSRLKKIARMPEAGV
ncbi:Serine/Threonine-kinase TNNI3K [Rhizoctonia solani AG-3 Rhs1AP]|uniref:Serine/Threonine-kinase TNNI3K n=1 Tax=Rhizoctonia solani AG-3 Rhs1AP TaxID=1086054 RepID=X8J5P4_9AGAM|nr:Serine/Threonine-kinase TNNI3K [Rhizoctonia solani AG-3 Rhs1AP]